MSATTEAPTYVTAAFLAERYGVAIRTIQSWRKLGRLPFIKLPGNVYRYPLSEVEATLAELTREVREADHNPGTPSGASR